MENKQISLDINNCGFFDSQIQLGRALANQDIRNFRIALEMGAESTTPDEQHKCVFETALKTPGCVKFVSECLRHGANPNYVNKHLNKAAINFATDSRDPQILAALLAYQNVQVDRKFENLTPLNSLAKNLTNDNARDVVDCIRCLLTYGASANTADQRQMTPILNILKKRGIDDDIKRELVELFITKCGHDLDLDTYRDGEARALLQEKYPDLQLPPQKAWDINSVDSLLRLLQSGNEDLFLDAFDRTRATHNTELKADTANRYLPLLNESIKQGLSSAMQTLLDRSDVDINGIDQNSNRPIRYAAIWGNYEALQKLLDREDLKVFGENQLFQTVIGKMDEQSVHEFVDYKKCFYMLIDSGRVDVNDTDPSGSTPLHYAVKYRNQEAIEALLRKGAFIGRKSAFSDLPIDGLNPDILEKHFDSCVTTNNRKQGEEGFEIIMNFKNFIAPENCKTAHSHKLHEEMAPIKYITESKEYLYLLQHPLITSYLFLKWHRLSLVFYLNFFIYATFAVSIITHTILKFRESEYTALTTFVGILSWIGIIYMVLREITQFIMSPVKYFRSATNIMEVALIILAIMTCSEQSYDLETKRVIAVFTILLVSLELCLLVGSLPVLSISTHMLMLRAVSRSFLKSFALYSIFVITFSICFYILFGKPQPDNPTTTTVVPSESQINGAGSDAGGEFNKFSNPWTAVIKTIVMLTGEFDAGDIDFDTLYSYLVFLLFVVFMSIVLFNLLNGLAVSDTQAIKAQAELNGSICRANLLSRYEAVLTGRSGYTGFIVNHEPVRSFCRRLLNLYPNYLNGRQISILPNDGNKVMIPVSSAYVELEERLPIRSNGTTNSKAIFLPLSDNEGNQQKKVLDPPIKLLSCCCSCLTGRCSVMDSRTVKLATAVIEKKVSEKRNRERAIDIETRLQSIEQKLERLLLLKS